MVPNYGSWLVSLMFFGRKGNASSFSPAREDRGGAFGQLFPMAVVPVEDSSHPV